MSRTAALILRLRDTTLVVPASQEPCFYVRGGVIGHRSEHDTVLWSWRRPGVHISILEPVDETIRELDAEVEARELEIARLRRAR